MSTAQTSVAGQRSDAASNRLKILAAARTALSESDGEVSMAEISRRAGVGMATLYRNFAGRHELLEALYADEVDAICRAAATATGGSDSQNLTAWLREFFAFVTSKRHVAAQLLEHTDDTDPVFKDSRTRVTAAGRPLLSAAKDAGEIRDDISLDQLLDMIHAIAMIQGDEDYLEPILRSTLEGLRLGP